MNDMFHEKKCPVCRKKFLVHDPAEWAYRTSKGTSAILYCSWKCIQESRHNGLSRSERRDKIIAAIKANPGMKCNDISKMIHEEFGVVAYWMKKLEREEKKDEPETGTEGGE